MLKNLLKGYGYIGIRTIADDEEYKVGDTCRDSYDWDYENDCSSFNTDNPVKLNGTCAIKVHFEDLDEMTDEEIMEQLNKTTCNYIGEQAILIGGYESEFGSDEDEIIINDATVLQIL